MLKFTLFFNVLKAASSSLPRSLSRQIREETIGSSRRMIPFRIHRQILKCLHKLFVTPLALMTGLGERGGGEIGKKKREKEFIQIR